MTFERGRKRRKLTKTREENGEKKDEEEGGKEKEEKKRRKNRKLNEKMVMLAIALHGFTWLYIWLSRRCKHDQCFLVKSKIITNTSLYTCMRVS